MKAIILNLVYLASLTKTWLAILKQYLAVGTYKIFQKFHFSHNSKIKRNQKTYAWVIKSTKYKSKFCFSINDEKLQNELRKISVSENHYKAIFFQITTILHTKHKKQSKNGSRQINGR